MLIPGCHSKQLKTRAKSFARYSVLLSIGVLVLAAVIFGILHFSGLLFQPSETLPAAQSAIAGKDGSPTELPAAQNEHHPKDSAQSASVQQGGWIVNYASYLNKLCAQLSEAEEDKLLAASGRNERVLLGLVFGNSPHSARWLKEALLKAPDNPLVHYAILERNYPGLDRLQSAKELVRLAPQNASPLYLLAVESLKIGNRESADQYLQEAFHRDEVSSYRREGRQLAVDNYVLAGRPENEARARVALENGGRTDWEDNMLSELYTRLKVVGPDRTTLWGSDEQTAALLDADQKVRFSADTDLITASSALYREQNLLEVISSAPIERLGKYLPAPPSEMLNNVKDELSIVQNIILFGNDKPGVYQRLKPEERTELIDRVYRDGEVSAYKWAYQTRPDIFKSPDFPPSGRTLENWTAILNRDKGQAAK